MLTKMVTNNKTYVDFPVPAGGHFHVFRTIACPSRQYIHFIGDNTSCGLNNYFGYNGYLTGSIFLFTENNKKGGVLRLLFTSKLCIYYELGLIYSLKPNGPKNPGHRQQIMIIIIIIQIKLPPKNPGSLVSVIGFTSFPSVCS